MPMMKIDNIYDDNDDNNNDDDDVNDDGGWLKINWRLSMSFDDLPSVTLIYELNVKAYSIGPWESCRYWNVAWEGDLEIPCPDNEWCRSIPRRSELKTGETGIK